MIKTKNKVTKFADDRLITITCVDEGKNFVLRYQFDRDGKVVEAVISVPKARPVVESVSDIFPSAGFLYEREIHDVFDVEFKGNPRLHEKLFLAEKWRSGHPLRK